MQAGDELLLVTFSSGARVDMPLRAQDGAGKAAALAAVAGLKAEGGTNIRSGVLAALDQLGVARQGRATGK
jgi:hypothetical protein